MKSLHVKNNYTLCNYISHAFSNNHMCQNHITCDINRAHV